MDAIKDNTTACLDQLTGLAEETLDLYRDLSDQIEDAALRQRLSQAITEQSRLIADLTRLRQAHGELPQAGDAERGHLLAMLTTIRALAAQNDSPVVERLINANRDLGEAADNASACDLHADEQDCVEKLVASCNSLGKSLHAHI
jgi:phage I-like protein